MVNLFNRIWGVGPATAESLYSQGYRTLEDLKSSAKVVLTKNQRIGLRLFDDLSQRMDRKEANQIAQYVAREASILRSGVEVIACGSFRRGKETCGDLDLLITHPNSKALQGFFSELIGKLEALGFLTDHLTTQHDQNQSKYLGVCQLPGGSHLHRRIDLIVVPFNEKATALLYFTGSAHFNRSMRLHASKKGMSLSEHCLKKNVMRSSQRHKFNEGVVISTASEESVFEALDLPFLTPEERDL